MILCASFELVTLQKDRELSSQPPQLEIDYYNLDKYFVWISL